MIEKIVSIDDVYNYQPTHKRDTWGHYDGFIVQTTHQQVELLITNDQSCCEEFGYFWCNDNPEEFIGAEVLSIDLVDTALNKTKIPELEEGGVMFINFETDKGTLQFAAYNSHNGYYGHTALVISDKLNEERTI